MSQQGNSYYVDIVMCIDGTGSMLPFIDMVKSKALSFYSIFEEELMLASKSVAGTRVKIIVFGDYKSDTEPMRESPFFVLPDQNLEFSAFVNGITTSGGGDLPENGYEAIATALKSDWTIEGSKQRHIILVFSDAPALPLGERAGYDGYPTDIPTTMPELSAWWEGTDQSFVSTYIPQYGRLIAFVPADESWSHLNSWNRVMAINKIGGDCNEADMNEICKIIVSSFKSSRDEQ